MSKFEQAKRIHASAIETMGKFGFGLMLDGETFYQLGYKGEPNLGIKFNMHQAYAIDHKHRELLAAASEEAARVARIDELQAIAGWRDREVMLIAPEFRHLTIDERFGTRWITATERIAQLTPPAQGLAEEEGK